MLNKYKQQQHAREASPRLLVGGSAPHTPRVVVHFMLTHSVGGSAPHTPQRGAIQAPT